MWEDRAQWLARMSKLLCTFAVLMVQPEQAPLSLAHCWAWIAHIVNINTPRPAAATSTAAAVPVPATKQSPFYTATALEVMLRVTAQEMHRAYGGAFLSLLRSVQDQILPTMAADAPRREELKKFLRAFLDSKGENFMSLFNRPVNSSS